MIALSYRSSPAPATPAGRNAAGQPHCGRAGATWPGGRNVTKQLDPQSAAPGPACHIPMAPAPAQTGAMRVPSLTCLGFAGCCLLLAGCAASPQSLGITGPGTSATAPAPAAAEAPADPLDNPAALQSGGRYGPGYAPTTGGGRYWGYD
jgi:hypothetical protein